MTDSGWHQRRRAGRPRSFDTDTVIETVMQLFWQHGYRATSTRELEAALGLRQSSIYNAFGSKERLLTQVLDRYQALCVRQLLEPLRQSRDGLAGLEEYFVAMDKFVTDNGRAGCLLLNMAAEDGAGLPGIEQRARDYRDLVRQAIDQALARAVQQGRAVSQQPESRADLLLTIVLGFNAAARARASRAELDNIVTTVRETLRYWRTEKTQAA